MRVVRFSHRDEAYVCYVYASADRGGDEEKVMLSPTLINSAKEALEKILVPRGLWKDSEFALWAALGE